MLKNAAGRNLENQPEFTFEKIMEEEIIFIRVALQLFAVVCTVYNIQYKQNQSR